MRVAVLPRHSVIMDVCGPTSPAQMADGSRRVPYGTADARSELATQRRQSQRCLGDSTPVSDLDGK
jgi:hypothetical protein